MNAALYLRSSRDRHDVSLAAQRHELEKLATSRSLQIVRSYEDAVQSGATEDRPGFSALVRALKDAGRGWQTLLVYDTSRIARRRYIAQAIKHEAKKRGVTILYARMPSDLDPVAELVLESVFEAMDEAHSLISREKGIAGMAENVRQGWRAGGRAPIGYALGTHLTGAVRDGRPVTKSKLVPAAAARSVARYLKARAAGTPRSVAAKGIGMNPSSLIGVEWNALTYAGHTVWNRHTEQGSGRKRRPRKDWQVTRDTHPALITDAEVEAILAQLETSEIGAAVSRAKAAMSDYLLTGILFSDDGQPWVGHGRYYRLKAKDDKRGKLVSVAAVDAAVLAQVQTDRQSDLYLRQLLQSVRKARKDGPLPDLQARIATLEREKARAASLALTNDADTFLALVSERSRQIEALQMEVAAVQADTSLTEHLSRMTVLALRGLLAEQESATAIASLVERVVLTPALTCRLHYKAIPGRRAWRSVASPGGPEGWPPDLTRLIPLRGAA